MTEHKPKVLYIPWEMPIHDESAWARLQKRFNLVHYDCESVEQFYDRCNDPQSEYYGIQAVCRPGRFTAPPFADHLLFKGKHVSRIPACLELIVQSAHGYDTVDLEALTQRNILFCNSPVGATRATADAGIYLILSAFRQFTRAERSLRDKDWELTGEITLRSENPAGHTLGIVGMGTIGCEVAVAARALGMKVVYHNRRPRAEMTQRYPDIEYCAQLNDLLAVSDCVCLLCPLNKDTYHLINDDSFKHMKSRVRIVNIARGPVVEEAALIRAMDSGQVVGLGLDVFEHEPQVPQKLLDNYYTTLLPHFAGCSTSTYESFERTCVENLEDYFFNKCPNALNPQVYKVPRQ